MSDNNILLVGVGAVVVRPNGDIIVGRRLNSHGAGSLALPGGKLEFGETFEACGSRELQEETGLIVPACAFEVVTTLNTVMASEHVHAVVPIVVTYLEDGHDEPQLLEPHKCEGWQWMAWSTLVAEPNVFAPLADLIATGWTPQCPN